MTLYAVIAAVIAVIAAIFGAYRKGYKTAKVGAEKKDLQGYHDTTEKVGHAEIASDPAVARDLLRSRDPNKR